VPSLGVESHFPFPSCKTTRILKNSDHINALIFWQAINYEWRGKTRLRGSRSSKGGGRSSKFRLVNVAVFGKDLSNNMQLPGAASRCAGDGDCEGWFQQSVHGVFKEEEGIDWKS